MTADNTNHSKKKKTTGLVLVTHGQIGQSMIDVAEFILGQSLGSVAFVSFRQSEMEHTGEEEIRNAIMNANQGQGVLVMTDIGGASPFNNVTRLLPECGAEMVNGLNLAMLIRAWNYRMQPAQQLAVLATEGAIRDIREFYP
jgi:mannose/fructose-specific phosphotransferase system component IIA